MVSRWLGRRISPLLAANAVHAFYAHCGCIVALVESVILPWKLRLKFARIAVTVNGSAKLLDINALALIANRVAFFALLGP